MEGELYNLAKKYALHNALQHDGKASVKAVIGKIMAERRDLRGKIKSVMEIVERVVEEVNDLSVDEQRRILSEIEPKLLVKEKRRKEISLPPLPHAEHGKVVTRFPPEPNGYLHIGHAKAAFIDYEYARMYDGKFILRFDDTNPENEKIEYYDVQKEDLRWLGIEWDVEYCTSSKLPQHYELAERLILQGDAYVCLCDRSTIRKNRFEGKICRCRERDKDENLSLWREMHGEIEEGGAVLRLKGDMKSKNTAMRDPTLFRIIDAEHPIQGYKYRVWPTYDFAGAVEDSLSGVTHPFRTKEYELRDEVYFYILDKLNLRKPHLMEFSRLSIEGMPVSKRKIKPLIDEGKVSGYDDFRLPTLRGLRRRGITPEAIRIFVLSQGVSKSESVVTFDQLEAVNRKIIDKRARRFFFVPNPVKIYVENAPHLKKKLKFHPTEEMGYRVVETSSVFFVPEEDMKNMKEGDIFRLKDLYNVRISEIKGGEIRATYAGEELLKDVEKIQWVTEKSFDFVVLVGGPLFIGDKYNPDSLKKVKGLVEESLKTARNGEIVQFERFGFVRIERERDSMVGIFTHK
ncbi:MAG: glutamate--tRNA ligase [Thermoplasmata archaeon]|nr:MAG: glutamate--tRNA ligase [Thermoplasmata archaeon]